MGKLTRSLALAVMVASSPATATEQKPQAQDEVTTIYVDPRLNPRQVRAAYRAAGLEDGVHFREDGIEFLPDAKVSKETARLVQEKLDVSTRVLVLGEGTTVPSPVPTPIGVRY